MLDHAVISDALNKGMKIGVRYKTYQIYDIVQRLCEFTDDDLDPVDSAPSQVKWKHRVRGCLSNQKKNGGLVHHGPKTYERVRRLY